MVVAYGIVIGMAIGLLGRGRISNLRFLHLRASWVFLWAAPLQFLLMYDPWLLFQDPGLAGVLMMLTYGALVAFLAANLTVPGFWIIAIGLALNLVVMAANGGLMPVSPESIRASGHRAGQEIVVGTRTSGAKGIILEADQTRLAFLSDTIIVPMFPRQKLVSLGDIVAFGGLIWSVQAILRRREPAPEVMTSAHVLVESPK